MDDVLLLSSELFEGKGSELSRRYPSRMSDKAPTFRKMVSELGLFEDKEFQVLDVNSFDALLNLRNLICHSKIFDVSGSPDNYELSIVEIGRPQKSEPSGNQIINHRERKYKSLDIRLACELAELMTQQVEEIRVLVWQQFQGWPDFRYQRYDGEIGSKALFTVRESMQIQ